jgi:lysophospholipase L1-like esterase
MPAKGKTAGVVKLRWRGILLNSTLLLFSVLFGFLLIEMGLRLMGLNPMYVSPERDRFWKYDDRLGWAHQPGQEGIFETSQFHTVVRINETGLRDRSHAYERQHDNPRILVLGDSFAWGYGVEESERFSQLLEASLDAEVINAGVSGYSTDQELLWYKYEGVKYDTDLVILAFTGNDIGDNNRQLVSNIYYKPRFVIQDGELVPIGYPVPETSPHGKLIYSLSQRAALTFFLTQRFFEWRSLSRETAASPDQIVSPGSDANTESEPFKLTIALIDKMRDTAEAKNSKFIIVATDRWWNSRSDKTYEDFIEVLRDEGFLVVDVESMPGFDPEEMIIPNDGHWSQSGHEFVAEKIQELIEKQKLLVYPD